MKLNRTRNKLLKNGFLPRVEGDGFEEWIDVTQNGTPISFYFRGDEIDGALKIWGRIPDNIQADEWNSCFSRNVKEAITLSRV